MNEIDDALVDHLLSLRRWIAETEKIVQEIPYDRFINEFIGQLALCKCIEQCGEIASRIVRRWPEFVAAHPEIEFRQAAATRNRIVHSYESLNLAVIWTTATLSIPSMGRAVETVLSQVAPDEQP